MGKYSSSYLDKLKQSNPGLVEVASNLASSANERAKYKREEEANKKRLYAIESERAAALNVANKYLDFIEKEKKERQNAAVRYGASDAIGYSGGGKPGEIRAEKQAPAVSYKYPSDAFDYAKAAHRKAVESEAAARRISESADENAGAIDKYFGKGTAAKMKTDADYAAVGAYSRSRAAEAAANNSAAKSSAGLIKGSTPEERQASKNALKDELDKIEAYVKDKGREYYRLEPEADDEEAVKANLINKIEKRGPGSPLERPWEDPYIDADGKNTGKTYRERKEEIEAALRQYDMYEGPADLLVSSVKAEYEEEKNNPGTLNLHLSDEERRYLQNLTQEEFENNYEKVMSMGGAEDPDSKFEITDADYREYYGDVPFVTWLASKTTFGDIPGVSRSLEEEGKLADNTNVNFEYLTDDEIKALVWVLHTDGGETVNEIIKDMTPELNRRSVTQRAEEQRKRNVEFFGGAAGDAALVAALGVPGAVLASSLPDETQGRALTDVFASAASVPVSVASAPLSFLDSLAQSIPDADGEVRRDPYGTYQRPRMWAETVRSDTARDIDEATGERKFLGLGFSDVYMAGMSAADSVVGSLALGPGYSVVMGMGAASDEMNRLAEKGATNGQAVVGGLLAGVAETVFEHVSLEYFAKNFIEGNPKNWADYIKKALVQAGVEGSEEVVTEIANTLTNQAVMRNRSDWENAVREYVNSGLSKEEAYRRVWVDKAFELWRAGASGALSGGMMAGDVAGMVSRNKQLAAETREIGAEINREDRGRALRKTAAQIEEDGIEGKAARALRKAAEAYDKNASDKTAGKLYRAVEDAIDEGYADTKEGAAKRTAAVEKAVVALTGERANYERATYVNEDAEDNGAAVRVDRENPIARIEGGSVYMNTDRGVVALDDLAYESDEVREMIDRVTEYGAEAANRILSNYGGEDAVTYISGMKEGILLGKYGDVNAPLENYETLTKGDRQIAVDIGKKIRAAQTAAAEAAAKTAAVGKFNDRGRSLKKVYTADVKGDAGTVGSVYYDEGVKVSSALDRANVGAAKVVAALKGNNIVLFDSTKNKDLETRNGVYYGDDGTIWVDLKAGNARQGLVSTTLGHELTHDMRKWAPAAYDVFVNFLISNYGEAGVSVDRMVRNKMGDMRTDDYDAALEDVIADACADFFFDKYAPEKIAQLEKTNPSLFEKIKNWIAAAIGKLREAIENLKASGKWEQTEAREALDKLGEKVDDVARAWGLVAEEAAQNKRAAAERNSEFGIRNSESETDVKYSERLTKDDYARYMELAKDPEKNEAELSRMVEAAAELAMPDSKIRLSDGKLRKVYHGTNNNNFTVFDPQKIGSSNDLGWYGRGFYFAYTSGEASYYGDKIISAYLDIKKPYNFEKELATYKGQDTSVVGDLAAFAINLSEKFPQMASDLNITVYEWNGDQRIRKRVSFPEYANQILTVFNDEKLRPFKTTNRFGDERYSYAYGDDLNISALRSEYKSKEFAEKRRLDAAASYVNRIIFDEIDGHTPEHYMQGISRAFTDKIKELGYDGIIQSAEGDEAIAFSSSQIKSADPVTYDENGNVIPLEERFNPEREDIRYSTRSNKKDVTETENFKRWFGDSKVVNEDGTPEVVYHGTGSEFYTFEKSKVGSNFGNEEPGYFFTNDYFAANSTAELAALKTGGAERIVEAYLKIENPYVVEAEIDEFGNPEGDPIRYYDKHRSEIRKEAQSGKYDGVIVKGTDGAEMYIVFDPEQIKSADPVTYNDHGRKIRKSRRFDPNNPDFRYSTRTGTSTSTRAVVERALETLKDGPEKAALTSYLKVLEQIEAQQKAIEEARAASDPATEKAAKNRIETLSARLRRMETAPALQNVAAVSDIASLNQDVRNLGRLLRLQGKQTGGAIALKSSIEGVASDLMKEHGIRRGKAELVEMLDRFYRDMTKEVNVETLNREYMISAAQPVADWLVENEPVTKEVNREVADVLREIKGAKIRVNESQRGDIINKFGNFETWRRSLYPYVIVTSDPGATTLDSFWSDMAQSHPEYFDPETSWGDQGAALAGVLSDLRSQRVKEYYTPDEALGWLRESAAQEVAEAFWKIKPYETVADRYERQIRELKASHKAYRSIDEYIAKEKQAARDLGYASAKMMERRRELRRGIRTLAANMSSRLIKPKVNKYIPESLRAATAQVLDALDLDSGRSKSLSEKFATLRAQYQKIIREQRERAGIEEDKRNGRYPVTTEDKVVDDLLLTVTERIAETPLKDMTPGQLDAVYTALKAFDHHVRDAVNAESFKNLLDEKKSVQDIGEQLIEETAAIKERKGAIARYLDWQVRPEEFFENLAGYKKNSMWHRVYEMLNNAQRKQIFYEMEGNKIFADALADEKYIRSLSKRGDGDLIDIGLRDEREDPYRVTRGMMLSIYKHLLNEDNARHIMVGGFVTPDIDRYYKGKTSDVYNVKKNRIFGVIGAELAAAYRNIDSKITALDDRWDAARIRGDAESMDEIAKERDAAWGERDDILEKGRRILDGIRKNIEAKLTDEDRALLAAADKFFGEFSPKILNEATRQMYGFDKARVENYFPIHVSPGFLGANFETVKHDFSVEGLGFMKDRIQSYKPIMLEDIGAVISSQIKNVAKYAALAPALKDFSKVYSVSTGGTEFSSSVSGEIEDKFGQRGVEYIENLIADLNGARDREVSWLDRLRSMQARAVLMLNPRVALAQAASYYTAATELGYGNLTRALLNPEGAKIIGKRADRDLIDRYTGMLWTRRQGNVDASVAAIRQQSNKRGIVEKKLRFLTGWIEAVDNATVGRLWYASEYYVQNQNPEMKAYKTSNDQAKVNQYYMKVADVFSRVIERSQPNYTVMQRPAALRSTNAMMKALTMFMTQRLQNASILYSSARRFNKYVADYRAGGVNGVTMADVKKAGADLYRAVSSQLAAAATIAAMKLLADVVLRNLKGRRDKDDDLTAESVKASLFNDFLSSAISNFVGGSELYEAIRSVASGGNYYGISLGGFDNVNDFVNDVVNLGKAIVTGKLVNGKGELDWKKISSLAFDTANMLGAPVQNGYKLVKAAKSWAAAFENEKKALGNFGEYGTESILGDAAPSRTNTQKGHLMLKAYHEGNLERYREIQRQFNDTADATARENADAALLDAVYEEWKTGAIDDREALDILEDCLAKPPKTENDERIQIGRWEVKKTNESLPAGADKETYGAYNDLRDAMNAYVFPEAGADRVTAGRKAQAMIEQYRAWGYDDTQIRDAIRNTFKSEYVAMAEGKAKNDARDYIAKLYTFTKDSKGKDYKDKDAKKLIDKWKAAEEAEEEDEREWG